MFSDFHIPRFSHVNVHWLNSRHCWVRLSLNANPSTSWDVSYLRPIQYGMLTFHPFLLLFPLIPDAATAAIINVEITRALTFRHHIQTYDIIKHVQRMKHFPAFGSLCLAVFPPVYIYTTETVRHSPSGLMSAGLFQMLYSDPVYCHWVQCSFTC